MALSSNTHWEVRTGGSDTACSGGFNPSNGNFTANNLSVTSGTTSAPVVTNAEYAYVAGDVGAWVFIQSGTNWLPGWYKISSVSAGLATIDATIGHCPQYANSVALGLNTVAGCVNGSYVSATVSGKGGIDYSQQSAAKISYTDAVIDATTNTKFTSVAFPVAKNLIGNIIKWTAGTGWTVQLVEVVSTAATVATCDKALGTVSSTGGTGVMGGAFASWGTCGLNKIAGNKQFIGSGTYTLTTATANTAAGPASDTTGGTAPNQPSRWEGYGTYRGDKGTRPLVSAGAVTTVTLWKCTSAGSELDNANFDGVSLAATKGIDFAGFKGGVFRCKVSNCTTIGFDGASSLDNTLWYFCEATACAGTAAFNAGTNSAFYVSCEAYANTTVGFLSNANNTTWIRCVSSGNTGASSDGFQDGGRLAVLFGCIAYNNGRHGFNLNGIGPELVINCIAESNSAGSAYGFTSTLGVAQQAYLFNCSTFGNTLAINTTNIPTPGTGMVVATGSVFTNAGTGDWSLNNTAGAGAAARKVGLGTLPRGTSGAGYPDIGAIQHQDAASAAGMLYIPNMDGV